MAAASPARFLGEVEKKEVNLLLLGPDERRDEGFSVRVSSEALLLEKGYIDLVGIGNAQSSFNCGVDAGAGGKCWLNGDRAEVAAEDAREER